MIQTLVSAPPQLDAWLRSFERRSAPAPIPNSVGYIGSDPRGSKLGSGGGSVSLLHNAWRESDCGAPLAHWLRTAQRLVLHAGGESRRLPAYAGIGKALLPVPFRIEGRPCRFDQTLSAFQVPDYAQVLREAHSRAVLLVASGDVWLDFDPLAIPPLTSDIAGIGMRVSPEVAQHFGVFFVSKVNAARGIGATREQPIAFFLQKPSPRQIYQFAAEYDFYVDTGLWLFSAPAVEFLFRRCGWSERRQRFAGSDNVPEYLDLYTEIGAALGVQSDAPPALQKLGWNSLHRSVITLDDARFFHVGSSRQLLESCEQLCAGSSFRQKVFSFCSPIEPKVSRANLPVWLDGTGETTWELEGLNVVSGAVPGPHSFRLTHERCVEIAPIGTSGFVVRPYLLDDRLRGSVDGDGTICGLPAAEWLRARQLRASGDDVFRIDIYPVVEGSDVTQELLDWFFSPAPSSELTARYLTWTRLSAAEIPDKLNFDRYFAARLDGHSTVILRQLSEALETGNASVVEQDFGAIAEQARHSRALKRWILQHGPELVERLPRPEHRSRVLMLLAELSRGRDRAAYADRAHAQLQRGIINAENFPASKPRLALKEDQIVWGRSPVRLDLAGGWTDTPPYCLEQGGTVLNLAVLLNGQPPIQVFIRPLPELVIRLRSIDLGVSETITTYAELETFRDPRSGFSLPKAALAMAGFSPEFANFRAASLRARLARFGGGLELSLLSAVPKGSGLGTSSILAATILGALNRACDLGWDEVSLYNRVLGVEQLLTTGGGWQDQAGALFRGLKLIQTSPGPSQAPSVRYLPEHLFGPATANRTLLLYYTGITRLAKGILKEIVHDMFLARFDTMQTLGAIRSNAETLFKAIQQHDADGLSRSIGRSWDLNKRLDPGTSTPEIERILTLCGPDLASAKLLGAGGGGYMLICAKTAEAGERIRSRLEQNPPNPRARFIDFQVAQSGLEVTVS